MATPSIQLVESGFLASDFTIRAASPWTDEPWQVLHRGADAWITRLQAPINKASSLTTENATVQQAGDDVYVEQLSTMLARSCATELRRQRAIDESELAITHGAGRIGTVRIGTWNMEGTWSALHSQFLERQQCDVWLLTEVPTAIAIPGMDSHLTSGLMGPTKAWAGIVTAADIRPETDPHPASAMAHIGGIRWISSVLPWRTSRSPWPDATLPEKLRATLAALADHMDTATVWGGDWNQALEGPEYVGTRDGRDQILAFVHTARLSVPTRTLAHTKTGHRSIDHIAVPLTRDIERASRVPATASGRRLSDHDAYAVDLADAR